MPCLVQDTVELQLLREVSARSGSFFQAAASLQHLRTVLGDALEHVRGLRGSLKALDSDSYAAAVTVKALQRRRGNLGVVLDIAKVRAGYGCVRGGGCA